MARDSTSNSTMNSDSGAFICKICLKSYTNRLSRNRHQLYCRKKQLPGQPVLRKSCAACRRAKIKCNSAAPCCSRCTEKKIDCVYEKTAKSTKSPDERIKNLECVVQVTELPSLSGDSQIPSVDANPLLLHDDLRFSYENGISMNWGLDSGFGAASAPFSRAHDEDHPGLNPSTARCDPTLIPNNSAPDILDLEEEMNFNSPFSVNFDFLYLPESLAMGSRAASSGECMFESPYLTLRYIDRSSGSVSRTSTLMRRQSPFIEAPNFRFGGSILGRNLLLQNIRSYTTMLLDSKCPAPFIHASAFDNEEGETPPKSENIANCQRIAQMHATKTKNTRAFVWRTIGMEVEPMNGVYEDSNEWDVLAMLQTITTYILLRIFDEGTFTIDFDNQLIETMTNIAIKSEQSGFLCTGEVMGHCPQWHEWILIESKRRTVILLFIIHLLFDINPGQRAKAMAGLSALPLPAHKQLWEARTEREWTGKYDELLRKREGRRYLSYADLVYLGQGCGGSGDPRTKDLNDWLASVDPFGILVMMAATTL